MPPKLFVSAQTTKSAPMGPAKASTAAPRWRHHRHIRSRFICTARDTGINCSCSRCLLVQIQLSTEHKTYLTAQKSCRNVHKSNPLPYPHRLETKKQKNKQTSMFLEVGSECALAMQMDIGVDTNINLCLFIEG